MRSIQRAGIAMAVVAVMVLPSPVFAAVGDWQLVGAAPAGDLDGDGRDDVVVFKQIETDAAGNTYVEVEAHRGHDGVELWSIDLPGIPEVVPDGQGGLFLAAYDGVFSGGVQSASAGEHPAGPFCCTGIGQLEMTLRRLSGDGTVTFERTFGGSYAYTGTNVRVADELTMVTGSLDTDKGTELLVATYRRAPGADEPADEVEIITIDRAGDESLVTTQALAGALTTVTAADDLDGDGTQDVLLQLDRPNADGELLAFRAGDNPAPLWTATTATDWRYPPASLGDADGDGVDDVVVDADGPYQGDYTTQTLNESVAVVSGATGAVRTVQGGDVRGVGDVNGDGAAELLTVAGYRFSDELLVETHLLDGASLHHLAAREMVGSVESGTQHEVTVRSMGDLDGDGMEDVDVRAGTPSGPISGVTLSGRDLSTLDVPAAALPLRTTTDGGDGDDVYVATPEGERDVRLSLRDGRTSAERWNTVIAAAGPSRVRLDVGTVAATAANRADLLVRSSSAGCQAVIGGVRTYGCRDFGQVAVYDGASGALRWRVVSRP